MFWTRDGPYCSHRTAKNIPLLRGRGQIFGAPAAVLRAGGSALERARSSIRSPGSRSSRADIGAFRFQGLTFPPRVVDLGNRPTRKCGKRLVTKTPRMRPVLASLPFAQEESDQFFEALLNVHGLQRSGIGLRGLRLDQTQACAGRPGFRFHWLRLPNGYGFKRLRHVIIHLLSHCGLRCGVSRPGAFIGRWSPGSERGRNVGLQVQVLGVPLTRDQLARAVAGREANREQNKYDEEPNHQTIRAHS